MRREFPTKVKLAAFERCNGHCEGTRPDGTRCPVKLYVGKFDFDHDIPNELGGEPTLDNCRVLCKDCHKAKTGQRDIPAIAKSKRVRAKHLGIRKRSKFRGWRKMDGTPVYNSVD